MKQLLQTLVLLSFIQLNNADILSGPNDKTYQRNLDTNGYLNCQMNLPVNKTVFWVKTGKVIYSTGSVDQAGKYVVSNTAASDGNFSLTITNLNRNDSARYSCQYGIGDGSKDATLIVADPPEYPVITLNGDSLVAEGQSRTFVCSSTGGYPAPRFVWTKANNVIDATTTTPDENGGTSTSQLMMTLSHSNDNQIIKCEVIHQLGNSVTQLELDVQYKPKVSVVIRDQPPNTVIRGEPFEILCEIRSNPPSDIAVLWKNNGVVLSTSTRLLQVSGIENDSEYQCTAKNTQGDGSGSLSLVVNYAPNVTIAQGSIITKNETQTLTLNCEVDAKPAVTGYKWIKADGNLQTTSPELTLSSVNGSHAGKYTCEATNQISAGNSSISVIINYAPSQPTVSIDPDNPTDIYMTESKIRFICSLSQQDEGYPVATYKWFQSGIDIGIAGKELSIDSVSYDNSSRYSCQASNMMGQKMSQPRRLIIHGVPEFLSSSSIEANYTSLTPQVNFTKGQFGQFLTCKFRGSPFFQVDWYRNNELIKTRDKYSVQTTDSLADSVSTFVSTLEFKGNNRNAIDVYDMGVFSCRANSSFGQALTNAEFTVDVRFPPEMHIQGKVAAQVGQEAILSCDVYSYPPVTSIVISKNGTLLTAASISASEIIYSVNGEKFRQKRFIKFSSVKISDFGSYKCKATNSLGELDTDLVLQTRTKPDAPRNLVVINKSWNSLELQWTPGFNGGETQRFIVTVNSVNEQEIADSTFAVTGLYPSTEYNIEVTAKNSFGESTTGPITAVTNSFTVPNPDIHVNKDDKIIVIKLNSTECCVLIMGSTDLTDNIPLFNGECHIVNGERQFPITAPYYSYYKAKACVNGREDEVCGNLITTKKVVMDDMMKWVIIGVVLGIILIIVIVAGVAVVITRRRIAKGKPSAKSISPPLNTGGQINHVMIRPSEDTEMEQPYATYIPPNNNLNRGRNDQNDQTDNPKDAENLDYIYASVQKKSAEQSKSLNEYNSQHHYSNSGPPLGSRDYELQHRFSPPPLESNSDNTEQDALDDMPVFADTGNTLSLIIGNSPPEYKRFSNISESGYSTPDSRAKRVVYEVIV